MKKPVKIIAGEIISTVFILPVIILVYVLYIARFIYGVNETTDEFLNLSYIKAMLNNLFLCMSIIIAFWISLIIALTNLI